MLNPKPTHYEMNIYKARFSDDFNKYNKEYGAEAQRVNKTNGGFTNWYRNATNHKDEKIGEHELKSIKLKINDYSDLIFSLESKIKYI